MSRNQKRLIEKIKTAKDDFEKAFLISKLPDGYGAIHPAQIKKGQRRKLCKGRDAASRQHNH